MILADTSIWVDHFRSENVRLTKYLMARQVVIHPFVIGELALGNTQQIYMLNKSLRTMPQAAVATSKEVLHLIEGSGLAGQGIGYVDVHLLASALLSGNTWIWTSDRKLNEAAKKMFLDAVISE
jgi:predicted nucleic acid-binding protein